MGRSLLLPQTQVDRRTNILRIPRIQCRGGRKRIVAPDGSELVPATKPQPDGTVVKTPARVHRWQGMLEEGRFASVRELAEAERVSLSYVSRILRFTLLAPDIVERILDGRPTAALAQLLKPFPTEWERQRKLLAECRRWGEGLPEGGHPAGGRSHISGASA